MAEQMPTIYDMRADCQNCGIELYGPAAIDGGLAHPIQLSHRYNHGVYCEACAFQAPDFGEYKRSGKRILSDLGLL